MFVPVRVRGSIASLKVTHREASGPTSTALAAGKNPVTEGAPDTPPPPMLTCTDIRLFRPVESLAMKLIVATPA